MCRLTAFVLAALLSISAFAQQRLGPIWDKPEPEFLRRQPQSGYDPFVLNPSTGRFNYVPIPYDPEPPGSSYNPFRFNWHSARWDYVSQPLLSDYAAFSRANSDASTFVDTRLDAQQLSPRTTVAPEPAPQLPMTIVPPPINPHVQMEFKPTTRPATTPNKPATKREIELARLRTIGRWEYNYNTGRWMFVLPSDQ